MGLSELVVATVFIFVLAVYMVVAAPTVDGVTDGLNATDTVGNESVGFDPQKKISTVKTVALVLVPTISVGGFIVYAYAAIVRSESHRGRM